MPSGRAELRRAFAVVKNAGWISDGTSVTGIQLARKGIGDRASLKPERDDGKQDIDADEPDAYAQLQALVAEQHSKFPYMTKEQLFAMVYSDPANRKLAEAERRQNRPV